MPLAPLRQQIDQIDQEIIRLLAQRMGVIPKTRPKLTS